MNHWQVIFLQSRVNGDAYDRALISAPVPLFPRDQPAKHCRETSHGWCRRDRSQQGDQAMKCERCGRNRETTYRVHTDTMDMKVCAVCAREARKLKIPIERLGGPKEKRP